MSLTQFLKSDGINRQTVDAENPLPVTGTFEAPAGGATEAKQDTLNTRVGDLTETAPATDTASSGLNGRLQRIAQRLTSLIALFPTSLGSKAAAASLAVTDSTEDVARIGIVTETAPATDTASSGLNGRLQRIAQRLTSLVALLPASLGQKAAAAALAVTLSDENVATQDAIKTAVESTATSVASTATVNVAPDSNAVMLGATSVTPKFAAISASSSGDNTLVAAVTSKKIRVLAYNLMGSGAVNARFQSAAAGDYLTGLKYIAAAGGGICAPFNPVGWFETDAGELLNLELSGAVAVGGELVYIEV